MSWEIVITIIWTGFMIGGVTIASVVLLWGIRNGQFDDQEHARSLALTSGIPREDNNDGGSGRTGA